MKNLVAAGMLDLILALDFDKWRYDAFMDAIAHGISKNSEFLELVVTR